MGSRNVYPYMEFRAHSPPPQQSFKYWRGFGHGFYVRAKREENVGVPPPPPRTLPPARSLRSLAVLLGGPLTRIFDLPEKSLVTGLYNAFF